MKYTYKKEEFIENLDDVIRLSEFISYKCLDVDEKDLRKKLKKIRKHAKKDRYNKIFKKEFIEGI